MEKLTDSSLKALVSLLSDDDKEVLEHVEQKIITLGDTIIPYLEHEWETNFNPIVQKRIEDIIHLVQFENLKNRLKAWKNNGAADLLEGMWLIITYHYPDYELEKLRAEMEQLYYQAWTEFKDEEYTAFDHIKLMNYVFYEKMHFTSNTKNFHSVSNSMLNVVLETRKGNPISLCVIYMLIAQRLKLPIYGVNLPNLFILTYKTPHLQIYINAFNRGIIFTRNDIDNYISHLNLPQNTMFYEPCNHLSIVRRVLRNMIVSFEKAGNDEKIEEVRILLQCIADDTDQDI